MTNQERIDIIIDNLKNLIEDDLPNIEYSMLLDVKYKNENGILLNINGLDTKSIFFKNIDNTFSNFEILVFDKLLYDDLEELLFENDKKLNDNIEPKIHYKNSIENRFKIEEELVEILTDENEGLDLYRYNKIDR